jgi:FMN reductase
MIKIVGIGGSLRTESSSYAALQLAMDKVAVFDQVETELIDLRKMHLPFCDGGDAYPDYPDVLRLQQAVEQADGLLLATPEYHGSVSGVLKNALDLMSFKQLEGKVVAAISTLGGQVNSNALNELRLIVRWVHGWMIPEQVAIGQAWKAFNGAGELQDAALDKRLTELGESLVTATRKLSGKDQL